MNKYQVWIEGYSATGDRNTAVFKGEWVGETFQDACMNMMEGEEWNMEKYYDPERNSYWGCKFYDNEQEARKHFG